MLRRLIEFKLELLELTSVRRANLLSEVPMLHMAGASLAYLSAKENISAE